MRKAEVKRTIFTSDGRIQPGTIIDGDVLDSWPVQNLNALIRDNFIKLIDVSEGSGELELQVKAQADRIKELESELQKHDLMFNPAVHVADDNGNPVKNKGGAFRRKTRSKG